MSDEISRSEPWHHLARWTDARIALGRAGVSTTTPALLSFNQDHALARDAIYTALPIAALQSAFESAGFKSIKAASRVQNRSQYLRRPDLGRLLAPQCLEELKRESTTRSPLLTVVVADGLSALAPTTHALPLLQEMQPLLREWVMDDIVFASQARVALGDEIGHLRGADAVLVLIGERPGLKSPDSLGAYLTYRPRPGRMDSERNCVSNIRPEGLHYKQAAFRLIHLLSRAHQLGATGVQLKDDSDPLAIPETT